MYSWSAPSNHAGNPAAAGPAGGPGTTGPPGSAAGVGLGGGAGTSATGPAAGPNPRLDSPGLAAQSAPSSSYQMPQPRWLPSLVSRSALEAAMAPHTGHGHGHTTLPNLRMGTPNSNAQHLPQQGPVVHPHHNNAHAHAHAHPHSHAHSHQYSRSQAQSHGQERHAGVSVVVEPPRGQSQQHHHHQQPQQVESIESSDSEQSDGGHREGRAGSGRDGSGDPDYSPSPGEDGPSRRDSGRRRSDNGRGGSRNDTHGMLAANPVLIDNSIGDEGDGGGGGGGGAGNDASRKHGKRLTTKEEMSLFDICNRRAEEFGQRSNLCNWWRSVTAEFTQQQGHPYSWHSVRRKVELVTKQRMKFLVDQRDKGGSEADDMSNPRWRAAVDAWIPTWQRWEDAEARRIEKRDSRRPRKRKNRSWESSTGVWDSSDGGWKPASGPLSVDNNRAFGNNQASSTPSQVRLPPGFDNMFTTPNSSWGQKPAPVSSTTPGADNGMMSAMLETLGKLNKHLDTVNPDQQNASPLASSLAGASNQRNHTPRRTSQQEPDGGDDSDPTTISDEAISKLKDELRQELREDIRSEMEKDRATFEERLDMVQRTQEMILEMLRQEPA